MFREVNIDGVTSMYWHCSHLCFRNIDIQLPSLITVSFSAPQSLHLLNTASLLIPRFLRILSLVDYFFPGKLKTWLLCYTRHIKTGWCIFVLLDCFNTRCHTEKGSSQFKGGSPRCELSKIGQS